MGRKRHRHEIVLFATALVLLLASLVVPQIPSQAAPSADAAVQRAWQRAQDVGVYHFNTEIAQTTYPAPRLRNAGRTAETETLYLEGRVNTPAHQMELLLRPEGGNVLSRRDSFEVRIDGDQTLGREPGGEWRELQDFSSAFAPAQDLLAYLAGAKNVRPAAMEETAETDHYLYDMDGPAFAAYVRDQLQQYLVEKGDLPPSIRMESAALYRDVKGTGEIWLTSDGLPARLAVDLAYPPAADGERVTARVTTDFFGFPEKATSGPLERRIGAILPKTPGAWQELAQRLGLALGTLSFLVILVLRRHSRIFYTAVVLALLFSMIVAPVVDSVKAAAFFDRQSEKQAQQEAEQAAQNEVERAQTTLEGPDWDPQRDPLAEKPAAVAAPDDLPGALPALSLEEEDPIGSPSDLCTSDEKNTDTDEDGLNDCKENTQYLTDSRNPDTDGDTLLDGWEVLRLGTSPTADSGADSDGDNIGDGLEVGGFEYRDKRWYSDPNDADTDDDGRPDGIECPERLSIEVESTVAPTTPCVDTDDDGVPDLFDRDSDEDGVPDELDLSPLTSRGQGTSFDRTTPFQLLVNNLQPRPDGEGGYFPTLVDFQLRPENPEHLSYAMNVLDWPSGDEKGQIQRFRGNDSTFADAMTPEEGADDPRAANGDLRLIPMLEIEMSGPNLPLPFTTAQTTLSWKNNFDIELTLTQQENEIEARLTNTTTSEQFYGFQVYEGICGDLGEAVGQRFLLSAENPTSLRDDLDPLVELADGEHVIMADDGTSADAVRSCVQFSDLPNGAHSTKMIDTEPLQPYGMSVRDKDNEGAVLVYTPLNVVADETGGGRTAFSARVFFQPQAANLGDVAQQVRVVWLVQALTDWCKPAPADAPEPVVNTWCQFPHNWELDHPQIVHSYYEDWYLTGLSVREDHGLNVAVAWEDPSGETAEERQLESWLWALARGLNRSFVSGRDHDENGVRDLGVATETAGLTLSESTIAQRFGTPPASGITAEQRFGIPLTATLGVETFAYASQDDVAHVMMTESERILEDNFGAYPEATPTLLFAREELYRSAGLDDLVPGDQAATLDLAERDVNVLAALSWSPYRFHEGTWEAYPLNEYWDHLGAVLEESFDPDTTMPEQMREDLIAGEVHLARAYYLTLSQGQVNNVQVNDIPLGGQGKSDAELAADITFTVSAFLVQMLVDQLAVELFSDAGTTAADSSQTGGPTSRFSRVKKSVVRLGRGFRTGISKLPSLLNTVKTRLTSRAGIAGAAGVGALLGVAAALVSALALAGVVDAVVMVQVITTTVIAATMVYTLVMSLKALVQPQTQLAQGTATAAGAAGATAARQVGRQARTVFRATMVCAVIGLIIGIVVAFAGMLTTIIAGHHKAFSLAANAAFAEAVAYTVVAVLMFAISMIPVVGQIIVAVIAAIDALIAAACAIGSAVAGEDVSERPGGFFCSGISGLAAEMFKQLIYSSTVLVDLGAEDRLTFGAVDYALPNPELGLSAGNPVEYSAELTNTIELVPIVAATEEMKEEWESGQMSFPVEWKSMSYWWQFKDENVKKSTFDYRWQTEEKDIEDLDFDSMSDEWQPTDEEHTFSIQADPTSPPIPLGQAGVNQRPMLFLSEGYDVPVQECFAYPSGPQCGVVPYLPYACLVPICYVRHKEGTNHLDLGDRFIVDVFPATLDEFYRPTAKNGGYSPAWAQTASEASGGTARFPVQPDFDGDGLLARVKGGADPDDGQWDTDGDGLNDAFEYEQGTDPTMYDTDGDGLNDTEELRAGTDPRRQDSDGDGLTDGEELEGWEIVYAFDENDEPLRTAVTSDPLSVDADDDTLTDFKERTYGFNPNCPSEPHILKMASAAREGDAPRLLLRFDDAAGSETFADASGYGKAATCAEEAGCPASADGRYVYGLHFDGEDALRVPHSEINALRNDLTVAAWIRPEDPSEWQTIVATASSESDDNGFRLSIVNNNIQFTTYGVNTYSLSNSNLPAGQWTHVAAVMGVDNTVTFYVNGVARGTEDHSYPANSDTDDDLLIGASTLAYGGERLSHHFQGNLDEVALFDRALGDDEVAALVEARYNPNDLVVQPGATLAYTSTLTNKLYDRYAQGLHSVGAVQGGALSQTPSPQTFVLQPMESSTLAGEAQVAESVASDAFTLTQRARAQITDWREASNYAQLWLPLNESAGATTFTDHSGSIPSRDATCNGASCPASETPGYFDYALKFNGNQYLTLDAARRLGLKDGSFSVSAWVKGSDFPRTGGAANDRAIVGTDGDQTTALQLVVRDRRPTMSFGDQTLSADTTLATDTWYHIVFRYDAVRDEQTIYINGDLHGTQTGVEEPFTGAGAVYLGRARGNCAGDGVCFQGTLDDVRTFRRALSLEEIRALYNRPVLRYQFEEENLSLTRTAVDASGFGNAAQCDQWSECPAPTSGVYGRRAAHFTGDDYFNVSGTPSLNLGEGHFTIAAWVWPDSLSSDADFPQGILGRYQGAGDTSVEGPGEDLDRVEDSYPSLFNVGGKLRFGYGTGDTWVTRTTSDTVLAEESWNHVVLSFGPESAGDGTQRYRAVLYVNNAVVGDWIMGEAPPLAEETDVFVGRASDLAKLHIDRFEVVDEADGPGDCEIYLEWRDNRIDRWGDLSDDDVVDVDYARVFRESVMLRAWEDDRGVNDDDPLCDINESNCEGKGHTFSTNELSYDHKTLNWRGDDSEGVVGRDKTHIKIYLGDDGTPAFFNPSIPFRGRMDELTMYKRPLSAREVQELYFSASMAMRLPFDDAPGSETFQDTVDVSMQGGAYCSGSTCPTAGISGRENQAARFDGVDDIVQTDLQLDQSASGGGATLAVWARPRSASAGVHDVIRSEGHGWSLVRVGDAWRVYDGQDTAAVTAAVDVGQWQHLAAVLDPKAGLTLYKNGVAVNDTPEPIHHSANTSPLTLGGHFDGTLDDARIFNRPLAAADIETLYERVPVFQLHLDEPQDGVPPFRDAAGGLEATCETARCPKAGVGGQVGLAAGFNLDADAPTEPLSVERTPDLETQDFTIGAWVLPTTIKGTRQVLVKNGSNAGLYIPPDSMHATVAFWHTGQTEQSLTSLTPLVMNQWNHVIGTYDGAMLRIYVNGYLQGEVKTSHTPTVDAAPLQVGSEAFAGRLDEITFYSRALASTEVRDIFRYQGKLVETHAETWINVDDEPPVSRLRSYSADRPYITPEGVALHVEAHDETSSVSLLELGVNGEYAAAPRCTDAADVPIGAAGGASAWCPYFNPAGEGTYALTTRATDRTGHRETPTRTYTLHVDATGPDITAAMPDDNLIAATRHPTLQGHWIAPLNGTMADPALSSGTPGSGVDPDTVLVTLVGPQGDSLGAERQLAAVRRGTWTIDYLFSGARPTGRYTVTVAAADRMGNASSAEASVHLHLDAAAPAADLDVRGDLPMAPDQPLEGLVSELPLPKDTLLALRFEEEEGATTFYDSSGSQRHGSCPAGSHCPEAGRTGQSGKAAYFDGSQATVALRPEEAAGINRLQNDLSVAAWIKPLEPLGTQRILAAERGVSPNNGFAFSLKDSDLHFETFGVYTYTLDTTDLQTGQWTHVAAVMDEHNDVTFYLDGVARATISHDQPANADEDDAFFIGSDKAFASDRLFTGYMDEVVVVGRAIGADEVRQLAQERTLGVTEVDTAFRSVLPGSPFHDTTTPPTLALQLPLDDMSDASAVSNITFLDLAGKGATATCTGSACPELEAPGRAGSAVRFDGREDTIALNNVGDLTTATVAAWIKRSDTTGTRETVLAYREQANCGFVLALDSAALDSVDQHPYAVFNVNGAPATVADTDAVPADTWVHLAASYDGQTLRLYRDGHPVAETDAPGTISKCAAGSAIGSNAAGNDGFFPGTLDDVRIYNRALSIAEIETLYLGRDPLLALPFDIGQGWATDGAMLADGSAWDHTVTLHTGGPVNKAVAGQEGPHALAFDGGNDYVAVAADPNLALDNEDPAFTQAAWVQAEPQNSDLHPILSSAAYDTPETQYPFLQVIERDQLIVGFGDGTSLHSFTTDPLLTPGTWHHVAGVFDGQIYTVYVDGEPRAETDQFAGLHPTSAQRFDVGRGARAEALGCATFEEVTLTGMTWEQQWRVRYQDDVVYESPAYPTAGRPYVLPLQTAFCGPASFEVEARYWDAASGWNWVSLGTFDLTPAPGVRSHTFSAGMRTGRLTWSTTTPQSDLRYFRGQLDEVRLYPRALGPLDVQRLYQGGWQPTDVAERGADTEVTTWSAQAPAGLEGSYEIDARGRDLAGHVDSTGLSRRLWSGELDTLAPRVAITRTAAGNQYHYETVAEDYNLVRDGFSSPCGAGVGEPESFDASWYRTLVGPTAPDDERLYRLTAECETPATGLFQTGVWDDQPWLTGQPALVTGTAETTAYVPAGRLWRVDVSDPARPRLADIYPSVEDAQNVTLDDTNAYVSEGTRGLSVLPLDDPAAPAVRYDTTGEALDAALSDDHVVVADGSGGLRVLDLSDPDNPVEVGQMSTGGDALGVAVSEMPTTATMSGGGRALPAPIPVEFTEESTLEESALEESTLEESTLEESTLAESMLTSNQVSDPSSRLSAGMRGETNSSLTTGESILKDQGTDVQMGNATPGTKPTLRTLSLTAQTRQTLPQTTITNTSAADDAYSLAEDTVLSIGAPGILDNDTSSAAMIVPVLVSGPATGTVELNHDGSLVYAPTQHYNGVLTFTYRASPLMGYWPLEEGSGTTTADLSGWNNTGEVPSYGVDWIMTTLPPTPANNVAALTFTGVGNRVSFGSQGSGYLLGGDRTPISNLRDNLPLTLGAWVRPENLTSDQNFLCNEYVHYDGILRVTYLGIRDGQYTIRSTRDTTDYGASIPIPESDLNQWVHLTGTYDGTTWRLYRNGVLEQTVPTVGPLEQGSLGQWSLGHYSPDVSGLAPLEASVDEVRMYSYALSGDEITAMISGTLTSSPSSLATVTLTVAPVNDWPLAAGEAYTMTEKDPAYHVDAPGLLNNDVEIDGDPVTVVPAMEPAHGTVNLSASGAFTYTPVPYYYGSDVFTYRMFDGSVTDTLTGTLAYWPFDEGSGSEVYDYTGNGHTGTFISDETLSLPAFTTMAPPTTTFDNPYALTFDGRSAGVDLGTLASSSPERTVCVWAQQSGDVTFPGTTDSRRLLKYNRIDIRAKKDGSLIVDATVNYSLGIADFWDSDWHHLCVTWDGTTARLFADGVQRDDTVPDPSWWDFYSDPVELGGLNSQLIGWDGTADDLRIYDRALEGWEIAALAAGDYHLNLAPVNFTITPVNDPPVAHADTYTPTEDSVFTSAAPGVLSNDDDVENDPLTATVVLTPTHGAFTFKASGAFTYTPDADFDGTDRFTYHANDGDLDSNAVTVTLNVAGVNDTPMAYDDAYTTPEDELLNVAAPGVLANDSDVDGDTLYATIAQSPTIGSLTLAGNGSLLYEPSLNYTGVTSFTYRADDGASDDLATAIITVTAVEDPPVAQPDAYTTNLDTPLSTGAPGLLANDSDPEGATLQAFPALSPTHGTADVALDGAFVYTPTAGFTGEDPFAYRAFDGNLSTTATVTVTVNAPPTAGDVAVFTQEEVTATIRLIPDHTSDPENEPLIVSAVDAPPTGTTSISGTTGVHYTPAINFTGIETFTYTVADPGGLTATARVSVTVGGVNDPPVAVDDAVTTPEDQPVSIPVLDNDYDPDGQTPQLLSVTTPAQGTAQISAHTVDYTPATDFASVETFTYTVSDGVLTATARVTVTVTPVNDPPTLDPLADLALEPSAAEQVVAMDGIGTGATNESQPLDVTAVSSNPTLIPDPTVSYDGVSTTGELRFTPTAGLTGTATVSVTVSDGLSETLRSFDVTVWDATGPFAYVAAGEAGLLVIDLSRPETPRQLAALATPDAAQDVTLAGDTAYVAAGAAGLLIVNVSTPIRPTLLASVATPGFASSASVVQGQVFIADGYTGVALIDASDPTAPYLVSSSDTPGYASRLTALGNALYVADSNRGLRIFDTEVPPSRATACDRAGNCTTAEATVIQSLDMAAASADIPATGVRVLDTPPVLMDTDPLTVTGKAFAETSSLQALTLTLDSGTLFTQTWASGVVSTTIWKAPWNPAGLPDGPHALRADLQAWDGTRVSDTLTVTLDTRAPDLTVATTVLTNAHYHAPGSLTIEGRATDSGGVAQVALLQDDQVYEATLESDVWRGSWYLESDTLPDNETFTITVRATDVAGRVKVITPTVRADVAPPTAPALTLRNGDTDLTPGMTVRELSPTLTLTWTASSDGSGPVDYSVEWLASAAGDQTVVTSTPGLDRTATYTAPEAARIAVRLGVQDRHGQQCWQSTGPFYADAPRTPDYVPLSDADAVYRRWMESGCTLLGVDRRMKRDAIDTGTLNAEQRLYGTWDSGGLRLAWTGANWGVSATESGDGDLFIYMDTGAGGATTAFDPYGSAGTAIHMPGVTPTSTVDAVAADALVWVRDAQTALLVRWDEDAGNWTIQGPLSSTEYQYDAEVNGGQTDLYLPFDRIGLTPGGSLDLVAFATEEGSLNVWATLPNANPLSSGQVVETATLADGDAHFALLHGYHWDSVGAGVCPNGSDGSSQAYPDTEVQAQLSATPEGVAYSLLNSNLFWLWERLTSDKPADVSSFFNMMNTEHPRVGADQTVTYTLRYRNAGTEPATNLYADVAAHYALRLTSGDARMELGDLAPGAERTISFQGVVDLARSAEPWAAVTVELYDDAHPSDGPPLERLWLDHQVDRAAPEFVGVTQPAYVLRAKSNLVRGYVYDESPVPELTLDLEGGPALDCPDATPQDGAWACELNASGYQDGDVLIGRIAAVDTFGQRSALSVPRRWVVDTIPPTATLTSTADTTGLLVADVVQLTGHLHDNHGLARAEVCLEDTCAPATLQLSDAESIKTYGDRPDTPLPIEGGACGRGSGIVRTFTVTESFAIGGVSVGFRAEHARRDDLEVTLVAPSGLSVPLLVDDGVSGTAFRSYDVLLDDTAAGSYAARHDDVVTRTAFTRQARPAAPLAAFVGQKAAGEWRLVICDTEPSTNDGSYLASSLFLSPEPQQMAARTGTWSYSFHPPAELDYVAQELNVVGIDLAGNRTQDPLQVNVIADNVAPALTVTHFITRTMFTQSIEALSGVFSDGSLVAGDAEGIQLSVLVEGPGGTYSEPATRKGTSWYYDLQPTRPGTYRLSVSAHDRAGNVTTVGPFAVEVTQWHQVLLPVVAHNFFEAPDLIIERIDAGTQGVRVVLNNRGNAPAIDDFWVDLYVDPTEEPQEVNQTWNILGAQGGAWGVTVPIQPSESLTLTVGDEFYRADYSHLSWPLPVAATVYAQVDSAGDPAYGGVLEDHEMMEWRYNNVVETTVTTATTASRLAPRFGLWSPQHLTLPRRP